MEDIEKQNQNLKECWERIKLAHEEHERKKTTRTTTYIEMKKTTQ